MKKLLSVFLILALLAGSAAVYAADGTADVVMDGQSYHLTLTDVEITDGQLQVTVTGFGSTLRIGPKGWMLAAWAVAKYGSEEVRAGDVSGTVGGPFVFKFDRADLPDEIWMDPYDDSEPMVLIWESGDTSAEPGETAAEEPDEDEMEEPAEDDLTARVLAELGGDLYRATYEALAAGELIESGSHGDTAKGVQQTLVDLGQQIGVDGSIGSQTFRAINAVQKAFGLEETDVLDVDSYAALLLRLLAIRDIDTAEDLTWDLMDEGERMYLRACVLEAEGKYFSAKNLFEECGAGNWEERAENCVQPWPQTGVLYRNDAVSGSAGEICVVHNTESDTAMYVKIYTEDGVLARTLFIGGTGRATASLPAGTYIIKDGTGHNWYGEEEAFGWEGSYEVMTFDGGQQELRLESGHILTITINVQEYDPDADSVGSDYQGWDEF